MVVYFATENLSLQAAWVSSGQLCNRGVVWPMTRQEGTFISLGADPETPCFIAEKGMAP